MTGTPDFDGVHQTPKYGVRYFKLGESMDIADLKQEVRDMTNILLGHLDPPIDLGVLTLMEVAEAFHARAKQVHMELRDLEAEGAIAKGSRTYHFRTGMLRDFIELASKTIDLGSRRVTYERDIASGRG